MIAIYPLPNFWSIWVQTVSAVWGQSWSLEIIWSKSDFSCNGSRKYDAFNLKPTFEEYTPQFLCQQSEMSANRGGKDQINDQIRV
jgi:hypothetical protein